VSKTPSRKDYSLARKTPDRLIPAPRLPSAPRDPKGYRPGIALIGCGGISATHLAAYRSAGYPVIALCDVVREKARMRMREYFPKAGVYTDFRRVLDRGDVSVVDVATHPAQREPIVEAAIRAGKHVLSQKPFVRDLGLGERLVKLADRHRVKLAVNQNGRFAPHFSWMRHAITAGLIGDVVSVHTAVHWDHSWTIGTPFERIRDLVLYDFGIHWFDIVSCFFSGRKARRVMTIRTRSLRQKARPPFLAEAIVEYPGGQASLVFDAALPFGARDLTYVGGTAGSLASEGPNLGKQSVTIYTPRGYASPKLSGTWFPGGFHGSMAELLCAIEENRDPSNSARSNLASLALCFAAIASADKGRAQVPGRVRRLPAGAAPGA